MKIIFFVSINILLLISSILINFAAGSVSAQDKLLIQSHWPTTIASIKLITSLDDSLNKVLKILSDMTPAEEMKEEPLEAKERDRAISDKINKFKSLENLEFWIKNYYKDHYKDKKQIILKEKILNVDALIQENASYESWTHDPKRVASTISSTVPIPKELGIKSRSELAVEKALYDHSFPLEAVKSVHGYFNDSPIMWEVKKGREVKKDSGFEYSKFIKSLVPTSWFEKKVQDLKIEYNERILSYNSEYNCLTISEKPDCPSNYSHELRERNICLDEEASHVSCLFGHNLLVICKRKSGIIEIYDLSAPSFWYAKQVKIGHSMLFLSPESDIAEAEGQDDSNTDYYSTLHLPQDTNYLDDYVMFLWWDKKCNEEYLVIVRFDYENFSDLMCENEETDKKSTLSPPLIACRPYYIIIDAYQLGLEIFSKKFHVTEDGQHLIVSGKNKNSTETEAFYDFEISHSGRK